jgi:amino acid permease
MLIIAITMSVAYGYIWLFELTGNPIDAFQWVMDLAGRAGAASWVIFTIAALHERQAKLAHATTIAKSIATDDSRRSARRQP